MCHGRVDRYVGRAREELRAAVAEDHTQRQVAGSFALGTFIVMLPTFGVGLLAFVGIVYLFDGVSKLALFASVLVFNPVVKWGVYAASFALGVLLLGPVDGVTTNDVSLNAGPEIVARLVVGNLLLAAFVTVVSYVVVHRLAGRYSSTAISATLDEALEEIAEEVLEP